MILYINKFTKKLCIIIILLFFYSYNLKANTSGNTQDTIISNELSQKPFYNLHFQQTFVYQFHPEFYAKYSGNNSLNNRQDDAFSLTTTLFFGTHLWRNCELYINPEVSGGTGLSKVQGIAGFPNNEVVRVGTVAPTLYPARLMIQQTINFDEETESIEDDANQLNSTISPKRLVLMFGKFSVLDYFDVNNYSHDGRKQFMNWALVSNGSWDYPADTRGYTIGLMAEYYHPEFVIRFAAAMVPTTVNGPIFDTKINKANGLVIEAEKPYSIFDRQGKMRLLLFRNTANCGSYNQAIDDQQLNPDIGKTRSYGKTKYGFALNIEQDISPTIGVFARGSWNDGHTETWMFTEIDRSLCLGGIFNGGIWYRKEDEIGIAALFNGLSDEHKNYLKAGGYGFIIGDGNLNYGIESIIETYYKLYVIKPLLFSFFYQFVNNPAYNQDRGPVHIFSLRTHIEF